MSDIDTDSDIDEFQQDIDALRRACSITGIKTHNIIPNSSSSSAITLDDDYDDEDDVFDDLDLLRNIKKRFSVANNKENDQEEVVMKPLNTILPDVDSDIDDEDYGGDFETLRAIQRRFSRYNDCANNVMESPVQISNFPDSSNVTSSGSEHVPTGDGDFPDYVDNHISSNVTSATNVTNVDKGSEPGSEIVLTGDGDFTASAQAFVEAIRKNRTYQKFLRDKLIHVEARLEENKKLRERVKFLKGFQVKCRKQTGQALSQKADPRLQLISVPKLRANASKKRDTSVLPINQGPAPNPQVAIYNEAKLNHPDSSWRRKPWSEEDNENLVKGIKQQMQETMMQNLFSGENADSSNMDRVIKRIKKREITPEEIRSFLPQVNWEQLAFMYLNGRSGPECESRWRNCEDPLINHGDWTKVEDLKLLDCFSNRGFSNWIDVAKELKTNRTPYQCLERFAGSLNPSVLNREWTRAEEEELRKAVAKYGENNWQLVASVMKGRSRTQCANKWSTSLNPLKKRVGRWNSDEDKRLKIAVRLFGGKNFNKITKCDKHFDKIAKYVPGRTQVQCRERWVNSLDPSINMGPWTEEEDMKLKAAAEEHYDKWAQVAKCIPGRTDSQCSRRWKTLFPEQAKLRKEAKEIKKRFLISNFVDREKARPQLTHKDFNKPLLLELGQDNIISKDKKQRTVGKDRPGRAKKVACTVKARKLVDEDDADYNERQADITSNGDGENCDVEEEASQGKERRIFKVYCRRAKQVAHTAKVLKLIDEDIEEDNDGHGDITTNGGLSRKTSLEDAGLLEQDNGEEIRTLNGDNCEINKKPTKRKRKQRGTDKHEEMDGLQAKTLKKCKMSCKLSNGTNENHSHGRKRNTDNSTRKREAVDGTGCFDEIVLEDEETFAKFLSKRKKEESLIT